jgi:hypothetical protein
LLAINDGSLTQANATLAIAPKNNTQYEFTYTISNVVATPVNVTLATPFASVATDLDLTAGVHTLVFTSGGAADVADFVIASNGGATNDAFTIDDISLREVIGGDILMAGTLRNPNGTLGLAIDSAGLGAFDGASITIGADGVREGKLFLASSTSPFSGEIGWHTATQFRMGTTTAQELLIIQNDTSFMRLTGTNVALGTGIDLGFTSETGNIGLNQTTFRPAEAHIANLLTLGVDSNPLIVTEPFTETFNLDGTAEIIDTAVVGQEILRDPLSPDSANWDITGDFADGPSNSIYTHSGGSGTLTQTNANLSRTPENNKWYRLDYAMTAVTINGAITLELTTAFGASAVALVVANGTRKVYFQGDAAASTADFVLSATSTTSGDTFTIDTFTLRVITGGDIILAGRIGGGASRNFGLRFDGEGIMTLGTASIVDAEFQVAGVGSSNDLGGLAWASNILRIGTITNANRDVHLIRAGTVIAEVTATDFTSLIGSGLSNVAEGGTGKIVRKTAHETHTLSLSTSSVTTTLAIPAGAMILGASLTIDTAITDDDGDDTYTAAFSGGSSVNIAPASSNPAQNQKIDTLIVPVIASSTTEITFTPQGTNFATGVVEIVVYYEELTALANV